MQTIKAKNWVQAVTGTDPGMVAAEPVSNAAAATAAASAATKAAMLYGAVSGANVRRLLAEGSKAPAGVSVNRFAAMACSLARAS